MKVYLEEVGKTVRVAMTPELAGDLATHREAACNDHPETDLVRLRTSNGGEQIRRQCSKCGHLLGGAKKREPGHENLPLPNIDLKSRYDAQRDREYKLIYQKHAKLQFEKSNSWFRDYSAYLETDEWREKRRLVLKRSGGICEGCGTANATQVHHLTYEHAKAEFLFELVAVCDDCHDRLHEDVLDDLDEATEDEF